MPKLDGSEKPKPVPYDSHEQVVRQPHEYSRDGGYQKLEPEPKDLEPEPKDAA